MIKSRRIYLLGGLGNNLYQVNAGLYLAQNFGLKVVMVSNIVESTFIHRMFRWTKHEYVLPQIIEQNNIHICRVTKLTLIMDLGRLWLLKSLGVSLGVSWEDINSDSRVHFGYFQSPSKWLVTNIRETGIYNNNRPMMHLRLGDSPTLKFDYSAQLNLIKKVSMGELDIVTNDRIMANSILKDLSIEASIITGDVLSDFMRIRCSELVIIPNSTFSLAAALSSNDLRKIYCIRSLSENSIRLLKEKGVEVVKY